ncbi:hypothetical protein [Anianabacter salinae]|uniref:hypothetical protein n=1 Tax=Anianabacter salinae TaxID=2851023 RepID=UPI00225E6423|nr:hypothetical protein [Anianabacter salinae]MBV0913329.1 hypothetical protein [Anianabacter salinae]
MKDRNAQDKSNGFYTRDLPAIACLGAVILLVLHLGSDTIKVDGPALGLFGFAIGIWFLPIIKKFKLGDTEIELWDRLEKIEDDQKKVVDALSDPREAGFVVRGFARNATDTETRDVALLRALGNPGAPLRPAHAAAGDVSGTHQMDEREATARLSRLTTQGLAIRLHGSKGPVWGLTPEGRAMIAGGQPLEENSR